MTKTYMIEAERLIVWLWREEDLLPFAKIPIPLSTSSPVHS
jgi:hypothetical protein